MLESKKGESVKPNMDSVIHRESEKSKQHSPDPRLWVNKTWRKGGCWEENSRPGRRISSKYTRDSEKNLKLKVHEGIPAFDKKRPSEERTL